MQELFECENLLSPIRIRVMSWKVEFRLYSFPLKKVSELNKQTKCRPIRSLYCNSKTVQKLEQIYFDGKIKVIFLDLKQESLWILVFFIFLVCRTFRPLDFRTFCTKQHITKYEFYGI